MNSVMIKTELLREWLIDYITNTIHGMKAEDSPEFDKWAASFKREEAEFVVNMEFVVECGDVTSEAISEDEARNYAEPFLQIILDRWYL